MVVLLEDLWDRIEHKAPCVPTGHHFGEKRIQWLETAWVWSEWVRWPLGESAETDPSYGKTSPYPTVLNSYYLNETCLQMNLDSHQPVHKIRVGAQGEERGGPQGEEKTVMMEKNQMTCWPRVGFNVEHSEGHK